MVNKAILTGHVGKTPEIRQTKDGREIANFSFATSESFKDGAGEKKTVTEWHNVVVFSPALVSVIKDFVFKGSKLYLEGKICTRKYEDKYNNVKYITEIVLSNFNSQLVLCDGKNE